jgi:hypothetical protein
MYGTKVAIGTTGKVAAFLERVLVNKISCDYSIKPSVLNIFIFLQRMLEEAL